MLTKYSLEEVCFDGCAFGLRSRAGGWMKKHWRVCTNDVNILRNCKPCVCSNTWCIVSERKHDLCHGIDCKDSENYTFQMTRLVHNSFIETRRDISKTINFEACTSSVNNLYEFAMCDCKLCFSFAQTAFTCLRMCAGSYWTLQRLVCP